MKQIEELDAYMLVHASLITHGYVHVANRIGNLFFGESVHRTLFRWTAACVARLGLEDERIVVIRGVFRYVDSLYEVLPGKGVILGSAASQVAGDGPRSTKAIFYSPALDRRKTFTATLLETGERKTINLIEIVILHELLHLRYPEKTEQWIDMSAHDVFFFGWDILPK